MSALVVADDHLERESLEGYLRESFTVHAAADAEAAREIVTREPLKVVLLSWNPGDEALVREIRASAAAKDALVVALVTSPESGAVAAMYDAGVDDFIRRPVMKEELVARVETRRSGVWRRSEKREPTPVPAAPGRVDLRRLAAFESMGEIVAADLSQLVGELQISEGWLVAGDLRGACIPMSVSSEQAEIRVSIVVETKLVVCLAESLLGDANAPPDALEDMLREIANTAGGAVKRAAADENVLITTGLPVNEDRGITKNEMTRCWTGLVAGSGMQLGIIGEILTRTTQRLPVSDLKEGMIASVDVLDGDGQVVMLAGTRLTKTANARIAAILGGAHQVEVMMPGC